MTIMTILEIESSSEIKMGMGSPILEELHLEILKQFQNNISHVKL